MMQAIATPISEFRTTRRVEFADTDMAGIVHFARFFVYMEIAEHEMLRSILGQDAHFQYEGMEIGWPRAKATCNFVSPARLGDILEIRVLIRRKGRRSMTYGFEIGCSERRIAEGEVVTICCRMDVKPMKSVDIPTPLADRLEEYRPEPISAEKLG
jgi:acyl-CoA thioester hydrolase